MARDFNHVIVVGRLTKDPEVLYSQAGKMYTKFSIANNEGKTKDGRELSANFFNCVAWEGTAELITKWFTKGKRIQVIGRLKHDTWQTQDGQKRSGVSITVHEIVFMDSCVCWVS